MAQLHLTLIAPVPSCPPGASCVFGSAEWRIDGTSPAVTVYVTSDAPGLPASGTATGLFALEVGPPKSGGRIDLLGAVTPGPEGLAWSVAQASTGSWSLAVIEGWLGAVNYVWPCPTYSDADPLTARYDCGHGEWLAASPAEPADQQLTPDDALRIEAGAYASLTSDPSAADAPQPRPQQGAYLVQAIPHSCPAQLPSPSPPAYGDIERCYWLKVLGRVATRAALPIEPAPPTASAGPPTAPALSPSPASELGQAWTALTQVLALAKAGIVGAVAHDGDFVAVGPVDRSPGAAASWTSPDGIAWTRHDFPVNRAGAINVTGLTDGPAGLVAVGTRATADGEVPSAWRSSDGVIWTEADIATPTACPDSVVAVAGGPTGYVVLGQQGVCTGGTAQVLDRTPLLWRSSDGLHWQTVSFPDRTALLTSATAGGPGFIVAGNRQVAGDWQTAVWSSVDGSTWSAPSELPGGGQLKINAISARPGVILAVSGRADPGEAQGGVWSSTDGATWTRIADLGAADPTITAIGWTPIGFVGAGPANNTAPDAPLVVQVSPDGARWQLLFSKSIPQAVPFGVAALSSRIVVVGSSANTASAFVVVNSGQIP